jgi:outer membrane protein TolC
LIDEVDVIRAEDAVRVARQNLLLIESRSEAIQSELAVLVQDKSLNDMTPAFTLYETQTLQTLEETTELLRDNSRLLKAIAIRLDQQKLVRSGYEEQGKTDLTMVVQVGLKNAERSYGRSFVADKPEARIGLRLSFPYRNRTAKAKIVQADLQSLQLEKQLEELTLELSASIANLLTQAVALESVLELNREQIESAGERTQEELKLYDQGRGELTFVIQSRDNEQRARLIYAGNALTYHKLLLQLAELTDQLYK